MKNMDKNRYFQIRSGKYMKTKVADIQRLYSKWLWLVTVVYKPSFAMEETGSLDFGKLKEISDAEIVKFLTSIKCIENWTAKMYLYRILYRLFSLTSSMDSLPVMCLMSILTISRWPKPLAISSDKLGSPGEYLSAGRFKAARFSVSSVNMQALPKTITLRK